jgi:hypothetical protein
MPPLVGAWLRAFVATWLVETVVAVPLLGSAGSRWRRGAAVAIAQLATHPVVWFVWPALGLSRLPYLIVAETWAVVIELLVYRLAFPALAPSRALAVSALANGASFALPIVVAFATSMRSSS